MNTLIVGMGDNYAYRLPTTGDQDGIHLAYLACHGYPAMSRQGTWSISAATIRACLNILARYCWLWEPLFYETNGVQLPKNWRSVSEKFVLRSDKKNSGLGQDLRVALVAASCLGLLAWDGKKWVFTHLVTIIRDLLRVNGLTIDELLSPELECRWEKQPAIVDDAVVRSRHFSKLLYSPEGYRLVHRLSDLFVHQLDTEELLRICVGAGISIARAPEYVQAVVAFGLLVFHGRWSPTFGNLRFLNLFY